MSPPNAPRARPASALPSSTARARPMRVVALASCRVHRSRALLRSLMCRSVRSARCGRGPGGSPSRTSALAAISTRAVGPQMYARADAPSGSSDLGQHPARRSAARSPSSPAAATVSACGLTSNPSPRPGQPVELVAVDDLLEMARAEQQTRRDAAPRPARGGGASPSAARRPSRRRPGAAARPAPPPRRSSHRSVREPRADRPATTTSWRKGDTSPSGMRSTVMSISPARSGSDAIE